MPEPLLRDDGIEFEHGPQGPQTYQDLFTWPAFFVDAILQKDNEDPDLGIGVNMVNKFHSGLHVVTDYSGVGSPEVACHFIHKALQNRAGSGYHIPPPCFVRASDSDPDCRAVLLSHEGESAPGCVMGDLLERCPPLLLQEWKALWLHYRKEAQLDLAPDERVGSSQLLKSLVKEKGHEFLFEALRAMQQPDHAHLVSPVWCHKRQKACCVKGSGDKPRGTIELAVGGVTCVDWSNMGIRQGWLGASSIAFLEWIRERRIFREDLLLVECVEPFDHEVLDHLLPGYGFFMVTLGPDDFGAPATRKRKYMALVNLETCAWHPDLRNPVEAFREMFCCPVVVDASQFCNAPECMVDDHVKAWATKQGFPETTPNGKPWKAKQLMRGAERQSIREWEDKVRKICGLQPGKLTTSFMNVTQSVARSPHAPFCPALMTRSRIWSMKAQRHMLVAEMFQVQGFNIFELGVGYVCPFKDMVLGDAIPETCLRRMCGNGMSMHCIGACICFLLACVDFIPLNQLAGQLEVKEEPKDSDEDAERVRLPKRRRPASSSFN